MWKKSTREKNRYVDRYVLRRAPRAAREQCGRFPGIIPVFDLFLINFEWYWYWYLKVVFELFDCFSQLSL